MARTARNTKVDSRSARLKLTLRREPYWTKLSSGCHLGYRRIDGGGSWIARFRDKATGKRIYSALGAADDYRDADNVATFDFDHAQELGRAFFRIETEKISGDWTPSHDTITVAEGFALYLADYEQRDGKALANTSNVINAHILPDLGDVRISKLSRGRIAVWRDKLVNSAPRVRSKRGQPVKYRAGGSAKRKRQSTVNRILTVLKAGLNFLLRDGKVSCRPVWEQVAPYRNVDSSRVRFLNDKEARALIKACAPDFRDLVTAALLTGCRYSELGRLKVADYDPLGGSVFISESKSGKSRDVYLTDEGKDLFARLAQDRSKSDRLLSRANGSAWGKSDQQRPFAEAFSKAKVEALTFHELRHTYASRLIMRGASLAVVARQLGHTDTRMVEKHYGHLAPSYIADTVRAAFDPMLTAPAKEAAE